MSVKTAGAESPTKNEKYHTNWDYKCGWHLLGTSGQCWQFSGAVLKDMTNIKSRTVLLILMTPLALLVLDKNTAAGRTLCSFPR